jgi:hypothetical protein
LNAAVINAYVIFKLASGARLRKRPTIGPFPVGGTDATSARPARLGAFASPPAATRCAISPPKEWPTSTGDVDRDAQSEATSDACVSTVPATTASGSGGMSLAPCPRKESA